MLVYISDTKKETWKFVGKVDKPHYAIYWYIFSVVRRVYNVLCSGFSYQQDS